MSNSSSYLTTRMRREFSNIFSFSSPSLESSQLTQTLPPRCRVQHIISSHLVNGTHYPESQILSIFHGTCLAVRAMHQHKSGPSSSSSSLPPSSNSSSSTQPSAKSMSKGKGKSKQTLAYPPQESDFSLEEEEEDEEEDEAEETVEGQALISGLDAERDRLREEEGIIEGMGDQDGAVLLGRLVSSTTKDDGGRGGGGLNAWAHRDIKPVRYPFLSPFLRDSPFFFDLVPTIARYLEIFLPIPSLISFSLSKSETDQRDKTTRSPGEHNDFRRWHDSNPNGFRFCTPRSHPNSRSTNRSTPTGLSSRTLFNAISSSRIIRRKSQVPLHSLSLPYSSLIRS